MNLIDTPLNPITPEDSGIPNAGTSPTSKDLQISTIVFSGSILFSNDEISDYEFSRELTGADENIETEDEPENTEFTTDDEFMTDDEFSRRNTEMPMESKFSLKQIVESVLICDIRWWLAS